MSNKFYISIHDLNEIKHHINQADLNSLIIFDVDDILLQPADQILKPQYHSHLQKIEEDIDTRYSKYDAENLYSIIWLQRCCIPVSDGLVQIISNLQKNGNKVLALTNCLTGTFGKIERVENWRINELNNLGYHFEQSWGLFKEKIFYNISTPYKNKHPLFKNGIAFTCNTPKGRVLKEFLNSTNFVPSKIIFIDDLKENIKDVGQFAHTAGIEFVGIEYLKEIKRVTAPVNIERALIQFKVLEKEHKWISDNEAENRLGKILE